MERRRRIARIYGIRGSSRDDPLSENAGDSRIEIDPPEQERTVTIEIEEDEARKEAEPDKAPVGSGGFKGGPL